MNTKTPRRLVIGISGASGTIYGVRMLEMLQKTDIETHLVMSKSAEMTLVYETKFKPKDVRALASVNHTVAEVDQWEGAHFKEDDMRKKVKAAKKRYEDALREKFFGF